ncbi:MAG: hypothetical protein IJ520_05210 [Synergistaceae bacterium]|nr:hypothetical protein [Synergistaceae bacterium]MBR1602993.1 hypothetical protein [Synergistaceae bacterium]
MKLARIRRESNKFSQGALCLFICIIARQAGMYKSSVIQPVKNQRLEFLGCCKQHGQNS